MNNKNFVIALLVVAITAILAYFLGALVNLDSLSLIVGVFLGGFVGALIGSHHIGPEAAKSNTSKARPQAMPAANSSSFQTIFVGNLPYKANTYNLRKLFENYGTVKSVRIAIDKETRKKRSFGFIEMNTQDANKAISELNDEPFYGRELKVSHAREKIH